MKTMVYFLQNVGRAAGLYLLAASLLVAQDWKSVESLPGVDLKALTSSQRAPVLKILREHSCSCGCSMKLAQCRMEDPSCSYSTGLAAAIVDAIKQGKSEQEAIAAAAGSHWAHAPEPKLLEDPVSIPTAGSPLLGAARAPITLVEFSDFQCPYCIAAVPQIDAVMKAYGDKVRLIFKEYPLDTHADAFFAATAALAAHKQGKFWPMHYGMFARHGDLSRPAILSVAKETGLDSALFEKDLNSKEIHDAVTKDVADGDRAGVEGTPTLFINGQRYNGPITIESLKPVLDAALKNVPTTQTASARR